MDRSGAGRERGAAALEFALVVPILMGLVMGIVDFGIAINRDTLVNNAVREGAREASLNPDATQVEAVVRRVLTSLPADAVTVTVGCRTPAGTACASFAAGAASGGTAIVTVTYRHELVTPISSLVGDSLTLSETAEMRIE
ncbi:TadE/TadG family type IV pilus assembly protein [Nocardioides daejeonensis]|uniref:TadE/TadG family type IV pilus assembly protein n=1 Tax=Nocardioides daejeonensis TaxID=1046556 RepID=UPI000D74AA74|nr:TadE family protein [Nocardioides daejeonensis]